MDGATVSSQVTSCLERIRELTRLCRQSITAEDPQVLLDNLQERQQCMNQIDALRTGEPSWSDQQRRILSEITELDQNVQPAAQDLMAAYRRQLLEIRKQRQIQAYARIPGRSRHYLDTCE